MFRLSSGGGLDSVSGLCDVVDCGKWDVQQETFGCTGKCFMLLLVQDFEQVVGRHLSSACSRASHDSFFIVDVLLLAGERDQRIGVVWMKSPLITAFLISGSLSVP